MVRTGPSRVIVSKRFLFAASLAAVGAVAACTKPYNSPFVEASDPSSTAFRGLEDQLAKGQPLRALYVHGMCTHDEDWVDQRTLSLAAALGVKPSETRPPEVLGGAELHERNFAAPAGELQVTFIVWSPLTAQHKSQLAFDALEPDGQFPFERASLNNQLKTDLLNDCLVDAVIYGGTNGVPIRQAMRHALCAVFDGSFNREDQNCELPTDTEPKRVVLITESLGSKLLFDAVRGSYDAARAQSPVQEEAFLRRIDQTQYLYMIANQVPLLDRADHEPSPAPAQVPAERQADVRSSSSLADFLAVRRVASELRGPDVVAPIEEPLTVVAFTDPNDLLSYRLVPEAIGSGDVRLINVILSNAPTIGGWLERPDTAHKGYGDNPWVMRYLVDGYAEG